MLGPRNAIWWLDAKVISISDGHLYCRIFAPSTTTTEHLTEESNPADSWKRPTESQDVLQGSGAAAIAAVDPAVAPAVAPAERAIRRDSNVAEGAVSVAGKEKKISRKRAVTAEALIHRPIFKVRFTL